MTTSERPTVDLATDVFARECRSRALFEDVTGRWPGEGPHRFSELRRKVEGVSEKMLSQALRGLESDGFVTRAERPGPTLRVDYDLTPLGREVAVRLRDLADLLEDAADRARG